MGKGVNGNLKSLDEIDPKEAFAIRSKGGKASACAQRKRKELKETLLELLALGQTQEEICMKLLSGEFNAKTFEVIRDTIGEKPKEVSEHVFEGVSEVTVCIMSTRGPRSTRSWNPSTEDVLNRG